MTAADTPQARGALGHIYRRLGAEDIFRRQVASPRHRALIRIAAVMGSLRPGLLLREAMADALASGGLRAEEVEDLVIHLASYAGMGAATEAMSWLAGLGRDGLHGHDVQATRSEAAQLDAPDRAIHGRKLYSQLDAERVPLQEAYYGRLSVEYYARVMAMFGCTFERPTLGIQDREIATVAVLASMGHCRPQLVFHTRIALEQGVAVPILAEILMHVQLFAGLPVANNAAAAMVELLFPPKREN